MSFAGEVCRLLLVGDTMIDRVIRWIAYAGIAGAATTLKQPVYICLSVTPAKCLDWSLGTWVAILLGGLLLAWTIGVGWERTRGPILYVNPQPELHGHTQQIRVRNIGKGELKPRAYIQTLSGMGQIASSAMPAELTWFGQYPHPTIEQDLEARLRLFTASRGFMRLETELQEFSIALDSGQSTQVTFAVLILAGKQRWCGEYEVVLSDRPTIRFVRTVPPRKCRP